MNKLKLTQPAFPSMPLQDSLGRMIIPNAGLSRLEYFALKMYCTYPKRNGLEHDHDIMKYVIKDAVHFLELIDNKTNEINDEKTNTTSIIQ